MAEVKLVDNIGEKKYAVYVKDLPMPELRSGWMHFFTGLLQRGKVTVLQSPKRLLSHAEAERWQNEMRAFDPGVEVTLYELVAVPQKVPTAAT